jgi:N-acetylglutamate synthase-like GNAT family acetyltransferase|tara:strand:- start:1022 stop:1387 length:366 start_codon:yes stop_codon:yes gene_type:complete
MTTRILPPEEWSRLNGTLLETASATLDPEIDIILVVEKDGEIVGCTSFLPRWHMEGTWIAPKCRKMASVGRSLLTGMGQMAKSLKAKEVVMVTIDPKVSALCARLGRSSTPLVGNHFSIGL